MRRKEAMRWLLYLCCSLLLTVWTFSVGAGINCYDWSDGEQCQTVCIIYDDEGNETGVIRGPFHECN